MRCFYCGQEVDYQDQYEMLAHDATCHLVVENKILKDALKKYENKDLTDLE